jgi:hypothetical protein
MQRILAAAVFACLLGFAAAADDYPLQAAAGTVDKADREFMTLKTGKKTLSLKVAGNSKVTVRASQKRGDKMILTKREMEWRTSRPGSPSP